MNVNTNELLNLSVGTMNSIAEYFIDSLQVKSNLSSPYRSVFVTSTEVIVNIQSAIYQD